MAGKKFLSAINSKSMAQIVIDRLTGAIIEGELKPGDKIPTEPELSELFNVGINTVREAVRILVAYGVLEIRRAKGTYVCQGFSTQIINPTVYQIILQKDESFEELIGLRRVIENGIMQTILQMELSDEVWEQIELTCDEMERELNYEPLDVKRVAEADIKFHEEIAGAINNTSVKMIHDTVVRLTKQSRYQTVEQVINQGKKDYLIWTHRNLIEKLKGNDMGALYQAINDSYFYWKDIYKKEE